MENLPMVSEISPRVTAPQISPRSDIAVAELVTLCVTMLVVSTTAAATMSAVPFLLQSLESGGARATRDLGLISSLYWGAMFVIAPITGRLSDSRGRRNYLLMSVAIYAVSTWSLLFVSTPWQLYFSRLLAGIGVGGVLPLMLAKVADASTDEQRISRFAILTTAAMAGGLAGPYLGGLLDTSVVLTGFQVSKSLVAAAILSTTAMALLLFLTARDIPTPSPADTGSSLTGQGVSSFFLLSMVLMYGVGIFEFGLSSQALGTLQLKPDQLGLMYTACALIMLLMQALFFASNFRRFADRYLLVPSFAVAAIGLLLFPTVTGLNQLLGVLALVSGGAGVAAPLISWRIASLAQGRRGGQLGLQSALSNLGQATGAFTGAMLSGWLFHSPYWLGGLFLGSAARLLLISVACSSQRIGERSRF